MWRCLFSYAPCDWPALLEWSDWPDKSDESDKFDKSDKSEKSRRPQPLKNRGFKQHGNPSFLAQGKALLQSPDIKYRRA